MPSNDKIYFEDFFAGQVREFGRYPVSKEEIIRFAKQYDPQPFHTDEAAANASIYRGLIGSGWMTCAIAMRMVCDEYILRSASMGSPGVDTVRWLQPVRPDDVLSMRVTTTDAIPSNSKPDRGIVKSSWEVLNQRGEVVMTTDGMGMFKRRPSAGTAATAGGA